MYIDDFPDGGDALADRFDRMMGLYYVCEQYHGGQSSVLYRLMCRSGIKPGPMYRSRLDREWDSQSRHYAARYLLAARRRGIV